MRKIQTIKYQVLTFVLDTITNKTTNLWRIIGPSLSPCHKGARDHHFLDNNKITRYDQ